MALPARWKCDVCGYIHEGPNPPDVCPVCGVGPEMFSPLLEETPSPPSPETAEWQCGVCRTAATGTTPPNQCSVCGAAQGLFVPAPDAPTALGPTGTGPRLLIVGGGITGITAAEYARKWSQTLSITVVSEEPLPPYHRLNLTRFLAGQVRDHELPLHPPEWYRDQQIELLHDEVAEIRRAEQKVVLKSGRAVPYDQLLLANGAHPFLPPIPGTHLDGVMPLRTRADAQHLLELARSGRQGICVGGGVLGLEVAGALADRGVDMTVLEGFEWLLPRQLASAGGELLARYLARRNIATRCGVVVEALVGNDRVRAVRLKGGEELPAEFVIMATGVRSNTHLARSCGLEVNRGVLVDDQMRTSDPRILAAGDVAEHRGVVYGLWTTALGQGAVAGTVAGGGPPTAFNAVPPANQLKVLEVALFSIGQFAPTDGSFLVIERREAETYVRLVCHDGRLVGANLIGDASHAGLIKTAVESRRPTATDNELLAAFPELKTCPLDTPDSPAVPETNP